MIAKVSRGGDVGGLLRYLMGPGKANEHRDPHVVAAWDGAAQRHQPPPAGRHKAGRLRFDTRRLAEQLSEPAVAAGVIPTRSRQTGKRDGRQGGKRDGRRGGQERGQGVVWHCSLRNHADDRVLSDAEWAEVVTDLLHRTGIARRGDLGACRWVAIRHAVDHVHVAVVLVRQDTGRRVHPYRDYLRARETCRAGEDRFGLIPTAPADRTAATAPTRTEWEKAIGREAGVPVRVWLRGQVRVAAVQARTPTEFLARLGDLRVLVRTRESPTGQLSGYAVAAHDDCDAAGEPVWYAGRRLARDLSLPRLQARWVAAPPTPPIPPAPTERSRVGRAERDAALDAAITATQDATRSVRAATAGSRVGAGGWVVGDRVVADAVAHAAGDMLTATATVLARVAARGAAGGAQAYAGVRVQAAAEAFDGAARAPGIGQPRIWPPSAARLRCAAGRLAAVRTLTLRTGADSRDPVAELLVALIVLVVEIGAYRQATQARAQARAAQHSVQLLHHGHQALVPPGTTSSTGSTTGLSRSGSAARGAVVPPASRRPRESRGPKLAR